MIKFFSLIIFFTLLIGVAVLLCLGKMKVLASKFKILILFAENEWAFDLLYCVAFVIMDNLWLQKNATYMDFNVSNLSLSRKNMTYIILNYRNMNVH